jgi:hypothetical protein
LSIAKKKRQSGKQNNQKRCVFFLLVSREWSWESRWPELIGWMCEVGGTKMGSEEDDEVKRRETRFKD